MSNFFIGLWNKFLNAFRGLYIIVKEERSLWFHLFASLVVIVFGIVFQLNATQWGLIVMAIGMVIGFEILNTAIEYVVDIVSFEYSVKAKKVKDVSAAATLFVSLISLTIGVLVFVPAIQAMIGG